MKEVNIGLIVKRIRFSMNKCAVQLGILFPLILLSQAATAQVSNISPEIFQQYGKDAYWEISVRCKGLEGERVVQRKTDGSQWCGKDINTTCAPSKEAAIDSICGLDYTLALQAIKEEQRQELIRADQLKQREAQAARKRAEQQRLANAAARKKVLENNIPLAQQRAAIENEKLELSRQELELQRRATELEELLKN